MKTITFIRFCTYNEINVIDIEIGFISYLTQCNNILFISHTNTLSLYLWYATF